MIKTSIWTLLTTFLLLSLLSCTNRGDEQASQYTEPIDLPQNEIVVKDAWARPGSPNGVSAIYLNVLNGLSEPDTLLSLSSPVAGMVEIHETYEREEGMMGMRPAETVIFPAGDVVKLEPGGMHVMLMQLQQGLAEGDTVELTLQLANGGEIIVHAPVQSMN